VSVASLLIACACALSEKWSGIKEDYKCARRVWEVESKMVVGGENVAAARERDTT
jgi:hypothetical protein